MFFKFAAWNAGIGPVPNLPLASIEGLYQLHPQFLLNALESYYLQWGVILGAPDYTLPILGAVPPNLQSGITSAPANERWDHLIYAYLIENTRIFEIFDRIVREYETGERFETPDVNTALWLRTTEALFYRDLASGFIGSLTSWIRPDLRATRRNTYFRLLGLDLNHGMDGNRPYSFDKPSASNRDFVPIFEAFLHEVWRGARNAQNSSGPNDTDNAAIADHARRLREMLTVRRNNGNLLREEFWAVVTMSWFHLAVAADTPIVRSLKAEATSPDDRLRKLGERVGIPAHSRSSAYFNMANEISEVLIFIETNPNAVEAASASGYYLTSGPFPQIADNMRTIITHWSAATGRDIKAHRVTTGMPSPR